MFKKDFMKIVPPFLTFLLLLGVFSCNTDNEPQADLTGDESAALSAEITGDNYFSTVEELSLSALESSSDGRVAITGESELACANISFDGSIGEGGELTVDFGSEGCEGPEGHVKKGKIIITLNGSWQQVGTSATISLEGFSIDGIMVEGSWTITGKSFTMGSLSFETQLKNGKVTWPNNATATRESTRTYTVTFDLQNMENLTVSVEGTASGTTATGLSYTSVITEPLIFEASCAVSQSARIPVDGTLKITSDKTGFTSVIVDFGDGECDETFTVTVGPLTKEMTPGDVASFI